MKYAELPDLKPGEPFFLLRAQDVLAPQAVAVYAQLLRAAAAGARGDRQNSVLDGNPLSLARELATQAEEVERACAEMLAWQSKAGAKLPD
jgi:hypothetical protein